MIHAGQMENRLFGGQSCDLEEAPVCVLTLRHWAEEGGREDGREQCRVWGIWLHGRKTPERCAIQPTADSLVQFWGDRN